MPDEGLPLVDSKAFDGKRKGFGHMGHALNQLAAVAVAIVSGFGILFVMVTENDLVIRISLLIILPFLMIVLIASYIDSGLRRVGALPIKLYPNGITIHVRRGISSKPAFIKASEIRTVKLLCRSESLSPYAFILEMSDGRIIHSGKRPRVEMIAYRDHFVRIWPELRISKIEK